MEQQPPSMRSYGRHLLLCNHGDCAAPAAAEALLRQIEQWNRDVGLNKLRNPHRIKCSLVDCLGVCQKGPILAVYPDGIWYHSVDSAALERIYRQHMIGGAPVEELIFHRLYPPGQEPAYAPDVRGDEPPALDADQLSPAGVSDNRAAGAALPTTGSAEADQRRQQGRRKGRRRGLSSSTPARARARRPPRWAS